MDRHTDRRNDVSETIGSAANSGGLKSFHMIKEQKIYYDIKKSNFNLTQSRSLRVTSLV